MEKQSWKLNFFYLLLLFSSCSFRQAQCNASRSSWWILGSGSGFYGWPAGRRRCIRRQQAWFSLRRENTIPPGWQWSHACPVIFQFTFKIPSATVPRTVALGIWKWRFTRNIRPNNYHAVWSEIIRQAEKWNDERIAADSCFFSSFHLFSKFSQVLSW